MDKKLTWKSWIPAILWASGGALFFIWLGYNGGAPFLACLFMGVFGAFLSMFVLIFFIPGP